MSDVVQLARAFCIAAHSACGQVRKHGGGQYHYHPMRVAQIVREVGDDHMVAAAMLHDVLEDTKVTVSDLLEVFPPFVVAIVMALTNPSKMFPELPRKDRKKMDKDAMEIQDGRVKTIKIADGIDNIRDMVLSESKDFLEVYMREQDQLSSALRGGNDTLYNIRQKMIEDWYALTKPH